MYTDMYTDIDVDMYLYIDLDIDLDMDLTPTWVWIRPRTRAWHGDGHTVVTVPVYVVFNTNKQKCCKRNQQNFLKTGSN
jgi:hypothetical protein